MHDGDRERANSIVYNLTLPAKDVIINNPFLNKKPEYEKELDLYSKDLKDL